MEEQKSALHPTGSFSPVMRSRQLLPKWMQGISFTKLRVLGMLALKFSKSTFLTVISLFCEWRSFHSKYCKRTSSPSQQNYAFCAEPHFSSPQDSIAGIPSWSWIWPGLGSEKLLIKGHVFTLLAIDRGSEVWRWLDFPTPDKKKKSSTLTFLAELQAIHTKMNMDEVSRILIIVTYCIF